MCRLGGAAKPGWRGDGVSRGSASGRRCPHPGRACADWEGHRCCHVNTVAESRIDCGMGAKARAQAALKRGVNGGWYHFYVLAKRVQDVPRTVVTKQRRVLILG
eukprot:1295078-Amphidinium_carterae.1